MDVISVNQKFIYRKDPRISYEAAGKQTWPGFIGRLECDTDVMSVFPLEMVYEARFPDPFTLCGGGDRSKHPQSAVPGPGSSHGGVIMIDEYLYTTSFDMLWYLIQTYWIYH